MATYNHDRIFYPGNICESVVYKSFNHSPKNQGRKGNKADDVSDEMVRRKINRVKKETRRLALNNNLNRFWTLTYQENITCPIYSDKCFQYLIIYLRELHGIEFNYIAVREKQERGAIHYHMLIDQYINKNLLENVWQMVTENNGGFSYVEKTGWQAIGYLQKYLTKNLEVYKTGDGFSKKAYLCSQNMKRVDESQILRLRFSVSSKEVEQEVLGYIDDDLKQAKKIIYDFQGDVIIEGTHGEQEILYRFSLFYY